MHVKIVLLLPLERLAAFGAGEFRGALVLPLVHQQLCQVGAKLAALDAADSALVLGVAGQVADERRLLGKLPLAVLTLVQRLCFSHLSN